MGDPVALFGVPKAEALETVVFVLALALLELEPEVAVVDPLADLLDELHAANSKLAAPTAAISDLARSGLPTLLATLDNPLDDPRPDMGRARTWMSVLKDYPIYSGDSSCAA